MKELALLAGRPREDCEEEEEEEGKVAEEEDGELLSSWCDFT